LEAHHAPQAHPAEQVIPGYNHRTAPAILIEAEVHRKGINPYNIRGSYRGSAVDLINYGIEVLRRNEVPEEVLTTIRDLIKQMYGI
jgi:hypothetical protein